MEILIQLFFPFLWHFPFNRQDGGICHIFNHADRKVYILAECFVAYGWKEVVDGMYFRGTRISAKTECWDALITEWSGITRMHSLCCSRGIASTFQVLVYICFELIISGYYNLVYPQNCTTHIKIKTEFNLFQRTFILLHISF